MPQNTTHKMRRRKHDAGSNLPDLVAAGSKGERLSVQAFEAASPLLAAQKDYPVPFSIDDVLSLFSQITPSQPARRLGATTCPLPVLFSSTSTAAKAFFRSACLTTASQSGTDYLPTSEFITGLGILTPSPVTEYSKLDENYLAHAQSRLNRVDVPVRPDRR